MLVVPMKARRGRQMPGAAIIGGGELAHKDAKNPFALSHISRPQPSFSEAFRLKHILSGN